ncbi:hypothetical protein LJR044_001936 [Microbacterium foliorum]|uniref:hypothetical protein n=1 Tax=Microbacterium sp. MEJ108Y TaxID=1587523 RepID=UPI0012E070F4|nr:hypothetical protein [Microbacterium sp. MEJ108Y]
MQGYAERFDFERQIIRGWVFDPEAADNRDVRVVATFDGEIVGETRPSATRGDLQKITTQDAWFSLECSRRFTALDVVSGRFLVKALSDGREAALSLGAEGLATLRKTAVEELNGVSSTTLWSPEDRNAVKHQVEAGNLSPMLMPAGLPSMDGSAVIGLRGHLFLTGGTNSLLSLYDEPVDDALLSRVDQWMDVLAQRGEGCEARGARFVQTIIPEKLTVLREDAPLDIDGPSPVLLEIESRLRDADFYVSGLAPFEEWNEVDDPFLMTDTHFSAVGAQRMFSALAAQIDPQLVPLVDGVRMYQFRHAVGDLTGRFRLPFYSRIVEPSADELAAYAGGLTMVEKHFPADGGMRGRRFRWTNSTAPSPLKVLVFGNSFFGTGDFAGYLSWWGKHLFREFHFHWGPDIDWDLMDELKPDLVVGQTVERFLNRVAAS